MTREFYVVENTPGYLPESIPSVYPEWDDAEAEANDIGAQLTETGYMLLTCDRNVGDYYLARYQRGDHARVVEIVRVMA